MEDLITTLRTRCEESGFEIGGQRAFELMLMACSACCTETDGGNKTCPPKPVIAE